MRKITFTLLGVLLVGSLFANGGQFEKAMAKNIPAMFQAETTESLLGVINQLNRVGDAESNRWEPYYYAAFGYIKMMDMSETTDDKDKYLDQALETIAKGEGVASNNSELEALRGYVHMMRVTVDPATRGMQYSGQAMNSFGKALKLNPNNPRALYLMGRMQYGTAQFMGNGDGGACENFAKAKSIFDATEAEEQSFEPSWGADTNEQVMKQLCKG